MCDDGLVGSDHGKERLKHSTSAFVTSLPSRIVENLSPRSCTDLTGESVLVQSWVKPGLAGCPWPQDLTSTTWDSGCLHPSHGMDKTSAERSDKVAAANAHHRFTVSSELSHREHWSLGCFSDLVDIDGGEEGTQRSRSTQNEAGRESSARLRNLLCRGMLRDLLACP